MRSPAILFAAAAFALFGAAAPGAASETTSITVTATAQLASRTSLKVSTELLHFDVTMPGQPAVAAVDFVAGARTQADAQVVLTVEPLRAVEGPGGAADVDAAVSFAGEGDGTLTGLIGSTGPALAGRWTGSGHRTGRLLFSLRSAAAGTYTLPVRFVLSAP